jgi:hypothetical protein
VIELGCDGLEVKSKGGYEEITAMKGGFEFGIREIERQVTKVYDTTVKASRSPASYQLRDPFVGRQNRGSCCY